VTKLDEMNEEEFTKYLIERLGELLSEIFVDSTYDEKLKIGVKWLTERKFDLMSIKALSEVTHDITEKIHDEINGEEEGPKNPE